MIYKILYPKKYDLSGASDFLQEQKESTDLSKACFKNIKSRSSN